ncbi:MAG: hypothetical protein JEY79_14135 [Pseudodesulfovibrio sp.]|nr:hypothetical protein [Pseudodesulfovibrio sp.]
MTATWTTESMEFLCTSCHWTGPAIELNGLAENECPKCGSVAVSKPPTTSKGILHLVTQDNQPYGSHRKCCEKCGKGIHSMKGVEAGEAYTSHRQFYKQAESNGWTACTSLSAN